MTIKKPVFIMHCLSFKEEMIYRSRYSELQVKRPTQMLFEHVFWCTVKRLCQYAVEKQKQLI